MLIELNQIDDVCVIRCEGRFVTGVEPEFLRAKMDELKRLGPWPPNDSGPDRA